MKSRCGSSAATASATKNNGEVKDRVKGLQRTNVELAKNNARLAAQITQLQAALVSSMEERIHEQEERVHLERQLMEATSALQVLKVELGKRIPVLAAIAEHLADTGGLFEELLALDHGEILIERLYRKPILKKGKNRGVGLQLEAIPEQCIMME